MITSTDITLIIEKVANIIYRTPKVTPDVRDLTSVVSRLGEIRDKLRHEEAVAQQNEEDRRLEEKIARIVFSEVQKELLKRSAP